MHTAPRTAYFHLHALAQMIHSCVICLGWMIAWGKHLTDSLEVFVIKPHKLSLYVVRPKGHVPQQIKDLSI